MYLGETLEEKRESYALLTRKAKKLGKVFGTLGGIMGVILGLCLMFAAASNKVTAIIGGIVIMFIAPGIYYWVGYYWFYGFMTVKCWFAKLGIGVTGATAVVGHSMAVSYLLGGKKTVKVTGIIWLIALAITLMFGFYVGLYNFHKIKKEVQELGIA